MHRVRVLRRVTLERRQRLGRHLGDLPGVDLIMPDISFVESIKADLLGLIITHAHEDHIGAVADLSSDSAALTPSAPRHCG